MNEEELRDRKEAYNRIFQFKYDSYEDAINKIINQVSKLEIKCEELEDKLIVSELVNKIFVQSIGGDDINSPLHKAISILADNIIANCITSDSKTNARARVIAYQIKDLLDIDSYNEQNDFIRNFSVIPGGREDEE